VILLEGSGASLPPLRAHRTICVTSAERAPREALSYLGPYRLLRSSLVALTGAEHIGREELAELKGRLRECSRGATVIALALEPEPAEPVPPGARVALFTTAPAGREAVFRERLAMQGVDVCLFSPNLARREALEHDLERADRERCDVFLTELKAAAIELVARRARERRVKLTFVRNRPVPLPGEPALEAELERLLEEARSEAPGSVPGGAGAGQPAAAGER
jgi:cyclic 2,3-diphosphoglycerate synthetase